MNDFLFAIQAASIIVNAIVLVILLLTFIRFTNAFELIAISLSRFLDREKKRDEETSEKH